jgi:hypothetical protein
VARRRRDPTFDRVAAIAKLALGLLLLAALGIGGVTGFVPALVGLLWLVLVVVFAVCAAGVIFLVLRSLFRAWRESRVSLPEAPTGWRDLQSKPFPSQYRTGTFAPNCDVSGAAQSAVWTASSIRTALDEIDWYQFEKFCAALLRSDGFAVERKGGAQPDGGVDLIAARATERRLVQCKHWRTWVVQEKVVREMLGSMTHFEVNRGAIYTLKGWTKPAAAFAAGHAIELVDGAALARAALARLSPTELDQFLKPREHHCPKCESPLVLRTGAFTAFWGCSTYPRCRGKLNHAGAR